MRPDCLTQPQPHLHASLDAGVLTLAIDRPETKNALYGELYIAMEQALYQADASSEVQSVIIRGAGADFTAGNDMQDFVKHMQHSAPVAGDNPPFLLLKSAARFSKPLIFAVRGVAIGIGVTLLLHADFVYCDDTALFQIPFVSLGLSPEGGSSQLLQRRAGELMARDLLLTARKFDATTAYQAGLITQIVADPYQQAEQLARQLTHLPLASLRQTKTLINHDLDHVIACIDDEANVFMQRVKSPEMQEALMAFKEKRRPDFTNLNQNASD